MISEIVDIIIFILLTVGVFFILLAGVRLLRFPDVYTRLHAGTKCTGRCGRRTHCELAR